MIWFLLPQSFPLFLYYIFLYYYLYFILAEGPGVALEKNEIFILRHPSANNECPQNFFSSPSGEAVWLAIRNIYTKILFYYTDILPFL